MSEIDHQWYELAFEVYGVPVVAEVKSRVNSQFFKDTHLSDLAKHVRSVDLFLHSCGLKIEAITVKDL